jgi:HK97 family phage major capsid protein
VLAQPIVTAERWTTFVPYSWELGQDWGTLQSELVRLTADARDVMDATQFFSGAGTASFAPQGIVTGLAILGSSGTTYATTTAATATLTASDLWSWKASIPPRFQANTTFTAPSPMFDRVWRLVGAGATAEAVLMDGRSGPLMGKPTAEWSFNAGTATPTSGTLFVGGDFRAGYLICDRLGLTAVPIPALLGGTAGVHYPTGQSGLAIWGRTAASVVNPNALRVLIGR